MLEFKQYVMGKLNEATEETDIPTGFGDEDSANVFYYIGRFLENKGPQTINAVEKYIESKFDNEIPDVNFNGTNYSFNKFFDLMTEKIGRKSKLNSKAKELWDNKVRPWHESKAREADPYAAIVSVFWDWYREKKKGNNVEPDAELVKFINNASDETLEKTFGKYYKFAMGLLEPYKKGGSNLTEEDKLIQKFWDWHRAKKAGKPYPLDQDTIDGLVIFLRKPKAVEVLQQYYYYFVRVIENLSDKNIKTPINTAGLQKELKRIMDNLDNDEFVDELEKIERNRLRGGDMTAGPVFVLPVDVIKTIRTLAKDDDNIVQSKVGKIDKNQVKECYTYCNNELNRKFHIGKTGIFDLNIQDFYDTYKIVFKRGFNTKTLHKIFDEVCQYLLDQLDKGTAEYWKNRGKIEIDDVEDFNEAYKLLKNAGYTILESTAEEDAEEGIFSVWDREKILKGQTPSWAKSVTELKQKAKKVKGSSSWSERAMRSVVGEKEPQTESEWRKANELNYKANKKLADIIQSKIEGDYQITKDCVTLFADNGLRFEIYPGGWEYLVKKINPEKLSDREIFEDEKLDKCIEWIEERI
jgi:hypothetical protein